MLVDATGTRRRLQALAAAGHIYPQLARHLQAGHAVLGRAEDVRRLATSSQRRVRWATALAVAAVYEELADTPGPDPRAAQRALARGWLVPWWWDEHTIDRSDHDPVTVAAAAARAGDDGEPDASMQQQVRLLLGTVNPRTGRPWSSREIAARLGTCTRTVERHRARLASPS